MICYKKNIKDSKIYTKEIFWFIGKHFIIFEIICIPIIIYYFLVGFLADKTVLPRGYFVLALFVFMLVVLIFTVVFCKRVISAFFKDTNGEVELTVSIDKSELIVENKTKKIVNKFEIKDIKSKKITPNNIYFLTKSHKIIFFPKTDELVEFFNKNLIVNSKKINK